MVLMWSRSASPNTPSTDLQLMFDAVLIPCSGGQPAPGPVSSGYLRPSITSLGFRSALAVTWSGQRFMASIASDGFSATCPSASMICMRHSSPPEAPEPYRCLVRSM